MNLKLCLILGVVLTLAGCSTPKPTQAARYVDADGKKSCAVYGAWDRYTWTGGCTEGYASGFGELAGYSGITQTRKYIGEMRKGILDGEGELTFEVEGVGNVIQRGTFKNNKIFNGWENNPRHGFNTYFTNGNETGHSRDEPTKSAFSHAVASIAQASVEVANTRSQAYNGADSEPRSNASGRISPAPASKVGIQSGGVNSVSRNPTAGNNAAIDPFIYGEPHNTCIKIIPSPNSKNYQGMQNICSFKLDITFCIERGIDSRGECSAGHWKRMQLNAKQYDVIDSYKGGVTAEVHAMVCQAPFYAPGSKLIYSNGRINGRCQLER